MKLREEKLGKMGARKKFARRDAMLQYPFQDSESTVADLLVAPESKYKYTGQRVNRGKAAVASKSYIEGIVEKAVIKETEKHLVEGSKPTTATKQTQTVRKGKKTETKWKHSDVSIENSKTKWNEEQALRRAPPKDGKRSMKQPPWKSILGNNNRGAPLIGKVADNKKGLNTRVHLDPTPLRNDTPSILALIDELCEDPVVLSCLPDEDLDVAPPASVYCSLSQTANQRGYFERRFHHGSGGFEDIWGVKDVHLSPASSWCDDEEVDTEAAKDILIEELSRHQVDEESYSSLDSFNEIMP